MYLCMRTEKMEEETEITALEAAETPALDLIPETYLVRNLGVEVIGGIAIKKICPDLEIDLGTDRGFQGPQALNIG